MVKQSPDLGSERAGGPVSGHGRGIIHVALGRRRRGRGADGERVGVVARCLLGGVDLAHQFVGPRTSRVAAPQGPGDAAGGRVPILAGRPPLALLIDLVPVEVGFHPARGVRADAAPVGQVAGASHPDLGTPAAVLLAPVEAALSFGTDALGWREIDGSERVCLLVPLGLRVGHRVGGR